MWVARKSASSDRNTIPAMVSRHRASRLLAFCLSADIVGFGRRARRASVETPNANIFDSVLDA